MLNLDSSSEAFSATPTAVEPPLKSSLCTTENYSTALGSQWQLLLPSIPKSRLGIIAGGTAVFRVHTRDALKLEELCLSVHARLQVCGRPWPPTSLKVTGKTRISIEPSMGIYLSKPVFKCHLPVSATTLPNHTTHRGRGLPLCALKPNSRFSPSTRPNWVACKCQVIVKTWISRQKKHEAWRQFW